ncbi:MAG TPA: gamma-glutamyl-gamma-aminobutyrate hydrolase family protein, partial [Allocoleopsis sp.]
MKKVCIINGGDTYRRMFTDMGFTPCDTLDEADLVCFTGGADVSPELYGHKEHPSTFASKFRDEEEMVLYKEAVKLQKPLVGICRGGQFLNVMSGGEMYQDVTKHTMSHDLTDLETGEVVYVTSTHHQMMKPSDR